MKEIKDYVIVKADKDIEEKINSGDCKIITTFNGDNSYKNDFANEEPILLETIFRKAKAKSGKYLLVSRDVEGKFVEIEWEIDYVENDVCPSIELSKIGK